MSFASGGNSLPFWVLRNRAAAEPDAELPSPLDKSGGIFLLRSWDENTTTSQINDLTGNGHNATFASGKEFTLEANFHNGLAAARMTATSLGIMGTANLVTPGSPFGFFMVWKHTAGTSTWYHIPISIRTATASRNFFLMVSNDANYQCAFGIVSSPGVGMPGFNGTSAMDSVCAIIINYNGGATNSTGSYEFFLNNTSQTLSTRAGTSSNNSNGNYINSLANMSPPVFPATDSRILEIGLYDSVISESDRSNIFVPYFEDGTTYALAQA